MATSNITIKIGQETLAQVERRVFLATLEACQGNKLKAAVALGISLKRVYNSLREYEGKPEDDRAEALSEELNAEFKAIMGSP